MTQLHTLTTRARLEGWLPSIDALMVQEAARAGSRLLVQEPDFYRRYCEDGGQTIIACIDGVLVGLTLLAFGERIHPSYEVDLRRLGVTRSQVAVGLQSLVGPAWRGRGLGRSLLQARRDAARARGLRYILSTTAPDNVGMLALQRSLGARELDRRRVYSTQVMRVILLAELDAHAGASEPSEPSEPSS